MTLFDREAFNFYMEGAKRNTLYRVIPMVTPEIANGLENIYTYTHRSGPVGPPVDLCFAIGKVKET